eukprot:gene281-173_t
MFRQMAGRAGRRGFDLMGNIIFLGMPFEKISQLVASDMPTLTGEMNLNPTTVLRALVKDQVMAIEQANATESKKDQFKRFEVDPYIHKQCFRSLFTQPFIALPGAGDLEERAVNLKAQLILHAKFSLEFLFQE